MLGVTTTGSLKKAIIGMILGDGFLNQDPRIKSKSTMFETSSISLPYTKMKEELLGQLTKIRIYKREGWKSDKPIYRLQTLTHPIYKKLYPHFYHDRRKTIDEFILKQIDGLALLFWFLDDGSFYKSKRSKGEMEISIATQNFNRAEHLLIQKVLNDKLQLRWNIERQNRLKDRNKIYYFLRLKAKDRMKFYNLIEPYIKYVPDEMLYKIPTKVDIMSSRTRYEDIV